MTCDFVRFHLQYSEDWLAVCRLSVLSQIKLFMFVDGIQQSPVLFPILFHQCMGLIGKLVAYRYFLSVSRWHLTRLVWFHLTPPALLVFTGTWMTAAYLKLHLDKMKVMLQETGWHFLWLVQAVSHHFLCSLQSGITYAYIVRATSTVACTFCCLESWFLNQDYPLG